MPAQVLEHDWFPVALPESVSFGAGTWIYSSFAFIHDRTECQVTIGEHAGVYNGTFFDLGPSGSVTIGNYCAIVGAIISTNRSVVIHDYVFIAHEVVLADSDFAVPSPQSPAEEEPSIVIGENAWIGARAVLLGGARVGRDAVVGAGTVVDGVVPDGAIVAGSPYRIIGSTT